MQFKTEFIFHIYNRGNNSQRVFFLPNNYLYFLNKIRSNIMPYCDILAWCLMPNHFHLMVYVKETEKLISNEEIDPYISTSGQFYKSRTINNSIGIMLRSYTRAIQKQENITGSLFQPKTKAHCINCHNGTTPAWFQSAFGTVISTTIPERQYPKVCFDYIHKNPVSAGLVKQITDWEYSSARDYFGRRDGSLVNKQIAIEFGLV